MRFDNDPIEAEDGGIHILPLQDLERENLGLQLEEENLAWALAMIGEADGYQSWAGSRTDEDTRGDEVDRANEDTSEDEGIRDLEIRLPQVTLTTPTQRACIHSEGFQISRAHSSGRCVSCEEVSIGAFRCSVCDIIVYQLCAGNPELIVNFLGGADSDEVIADNDGTSTDAEHGGSEYGA